MKNRKLKILTAVFSIFIVVVLGLLAKLFIIGEPVDGAQLYCETSTDGASLDLRITSVESAMAIRGVKLERDGTTLSISARKVLVSPLFPDGTVQTAVNLDGIETISLGGQIIWTNAE